jgi:hypothetical protein
VASILDAHEITPNAEKALILLTFSLWYLNWLYNTKNPTRKSWIFSFVSAGHNIICVQRTQHHLSVSSTSFRHRRTQMNDVAPLVQMKLPSADEVMLRINDLALRA